MIPNGSLIEQGDLLPVQAILNDAMSDEATRWIWFAGDVIPIQRQTERRDFMERGGGVEVAAETLFHTQGYVRRGRFTPVSKRIDEETRETLGKGIPTLGVVNKPEFGNKTTLMAIMKYPGRQIGQILDTSICGQPIGIMEIPALRDVEYAKFGTTDFQSLLLPSYPKLDRRLAGLRREIESVDTHGDPSLKQTKEIMLEGCRRFLLFGTQYIEAQNQLIKTGVNPSGFHFQYSGLAEVLFEQLELERIDDHLRNQATNSATMAETQNTIATALLKLAEGKAGSDNETVNKMMLAQLEDMQRRLEASEAGRAEFERKFNAAMTGTKGK